MENSCNTDNRFDGKKLIISEQEWKKKLSPEAFKILRKGGTEPPFTGAYLYNTQEGIYSCGGCFLPVFSSSTKYDSKTGWPSFFAPMNLSHYSKSQLFVSFTQTFRLISCPTCLSMCIKIKRRLWKKSSKNLMIYNSEIGSSVRKIL